MLNMKLGQHSIVRALRELRLLVNKRQHIQRLLRQHVQDGLVVLELNLGPVDGFPVVLRLLQLEYVMDEELLQVLVAVVDAELLEAVGVGG